MRAPPLARYRGMADLSLTNGAATFSVQKPAVQKHFALECEVCCGVNFALPSQHFQHTRGLVNNFLTICKFRVCNGRNSH